MFMDMSEINGSCIILGVIVAIVTSCLPVQCVCCCEVEKW